MACTPLNKIWQQWRWNWCKQPRSKSTIMFLISIVFRIQRFWSICIYDQLITMSWTMQVSFQPMPRNCKVTYFQLKIICMIDFYVDHFISKILWIHCHCSFRRDFNGNESVEEQSEEHTRIGNLWTIFGSWWSFVACRSVDFIRFWLWYHERILGSMA